VGAYSFSCSDCTGKIQRHKCKERFLNRTLEVVYLWEQQQQQQQQHQSVEEEEVFESSSAFSPLQDTMSESGESFFSMDGCTSPMGGGEKGESNGDDDCYIDLLIEYVMESRGLSRDAIGVDEPLSLMGFDSMSYIALARVMSQWVNKEVSPIIMYRYQTIRELSKYLALGAPTVSITDMGGNSSVGEEEQLEADLDVPIAIVGIGCNAPSGSSGGGNITSAKDLWQFFVDGGDAVRDDFPTDRQVNCASYGSSKMPGAYLEGIDCFDAHFFGISPAEASHMDYKQSQVSQYLFLCHHTLNPRCPIKPMEN